MDNWNDPTIVILAIYIREIITAFMGGLAYVIREMKRQPEKQEPPKLPEAPLPAFPDNGTNPTATEEKPK